MIINHNLESINIYNHFKSISNNKAQSIEQLSTGYYINRSADNAAGLSISEKMRGQIRGLEQASKNTQDGISLIQTAEGGMNEIHSLLQRCRELSVKAANDVYTDDDRQLIQDEISLHLQEIDTIANETEFNEISLLAGRYDKEGYLVKSESLKNFVQDVTTSGGLTYRYMFDGQTYAGALVDFSNISSASDVAKLAENGFSYTCCTCDKVYSVRFVNGTPDTSHLNERNPIMEVDVSSLTNGTDLVNKIIETAYGTSSHIFDPSEQNSTTKFVDHFSQFSSDGAKLYIIDNRPELANRDWPIGNSGTFNLYVHGEGAEKNLFLPLNFQLGSNRFQSIQIDITNVTTEHLGIDKLSVLTQPKANASISIIDNAITKVSNGRSALGAYQNRLEHTIATTDNTSENIQYAESRIRDTDMEKEVLQVSKSSILEQIAESLMTQWNQNSNRLLTLLS
ncbi:flagellin N-terminal helical domain-containing protein [Anaeromicropila populeti]|uniref:Flagellin n=1 Tax=Anaeromicropila populeti TaxID=37658 RepID=A0A1I6J9Z0_9FIRM|nr:flagellin [Anaeromicropila populeti]SFR75320.1 flagellin [Anaeromicropila populeti]